MTEDELNAKLSEMEATLQALDLTQTDLTSEEEALKQKGLLLIEICKYRAAGIDRASTAIIAVGVLTPGIQWFTGAIAVPDLELSITVCICMIGAFILHLDGARVLKEGYKT